MAKDKRKFCGKGMPFAYFGLQLMGAYFGWLAATELAEFIGATGYAKYVIWLAVGVYVYRAYKETERVLQRQMYHCSKKMGWK